MRRWNRRKGFSLAEAMLATVVLGIAAGGVLLPFSSGAVIRAEGMHMTCGAVLATDLMERIGNTLFDKIIPSGVSYTETEAQGQVKNAAGQLFTDPGYAKFSRSSTCTYVYVPQETSPGASYNFILAKVEVFYGGKPVAIINRLISR